MKCMESSQKHLFFVIKIDEFNLKRPKTKTDYASDIVFINGIPPVLKLKLQIFLGCVFSMFVFIIFLFADQWMQTSKLIANDDQMG